MINIQGLKFVVTACFLSHCVSATAADWVHVVKIESTADITVMDIESLKKAGTVVTAWFKTTNAKPIKTLVEQSANRKPKDEYVAWTMQQMTIKCDDAEMALRTAAEYRKDGTIIGMSSLVKSPYSAVLPDSLGSFMFKTACSYVNSN